jgi:hypothetical protein
MELYLYSPYTPSWKGQENYLYPSFKAFATIHITLMVSKRRHLKQNRSPLRDPEAVSVPLSFLKSIMGSFDLLKLNLDTVCLLQGDSPFGKSEAYIKLEQLGEGSYATVFKGYSKYVLSISLTQLLQRFVNCLFHNFIFTYYENYTH